MACTLDTGLCQQTRKEHIDNCAARAMGILNAAGITIKYLPNPIAVMQSASHVKGAETQVIKQNSVIPDSLQSKTPTYEKK